MTSFQILATDAAGTARRGRLSLAHGTVETPAFMPVGTAGSVKAVTFSDVEAAGASIVLANTYHLMLRPGGEFLRNASGLHRFIGWARPVLTDSGGYQVMSLAKRRVLREEGVLFRSHIDGQEFLLTPESAAELQFRDFGSDIGMVLDECTPYPSTLEEARRSMELTHRWAVRGRSALENLRQSDERAQTLLQFGIVQGGMHEELRRESVSFISSAGFEGVACGGVSVGEPKAEMRHMVELTGPLLPEDRPRYLMGVGRPDDLIHAVSWGFDLFDCVLPTRSARHGLAFTAHGPLTIKNARYKADFRPLMEGCPCECCRRHTRAYLRHLFLLGEPTAAILLTLHNLRLILDLMRRIREALDADRFAEWAANAMRDLSTGKESL